jgi:hypothetical protein
MAGTIRRDWLSCAKPVNGLSIHDRSSKIRDERSAKAPLAVLQPDFVLKAGAQRWPYLVGRFCICSDGLASWRAIVRCSPADKGCCLTPSLTIIIRELPGAPASRLETAGHLASGEWPFALALFEALRKISEVSGESWQ